MDDAVNGVDPYADPTTGVLVNKLGIDNSAALAEAEDDVVIAGLDVLRMQPIRGHFDFAHLCAIHRYLFGPIYTWAGEPRTVTIGKGGSLFALPPYIAPYAEQIFGELAREGYLRGLASEQFVRRAAYYLAEINALHPFREGNGRTQREFLSELAAHAGYHIAWEKTTALAMTEASIRGMRGDLSGFEDILRDIVRPLEP